MTPRPLLSWLDEPPADRGIRFAQAGEDWDFWSYERLADLTRRTAAGLVAAGVPAGSVVSIVQRSGPHFVATLFGAMAGGYVPSPVAPPLTFQDPGQYAEHVTSIFTAARPAAVIVDADLLGPIGPLARAAGVPLVSTAADVVAADPDVDRPPAPLAILQFTSGSSGTARGVRVPFPALEANVEAIRRWLDMTPYDATASWLPAHHDMGLIGCLVTPVVNQSDIWLMQPEEFVHRPLRYLRCFGRDGARLTAMPNFGLEYIVRRVRPAHLDGLEFGHWRAVIIGAERLNAAALRGFHELLAPHGLDRRALLPAYGLAESTLAVTGLPLAEEWSELTVDPASLALGQKVTVTPAEAGSQALVGCGRPVHGAAVAVDDDGTPLPDGCVGEIVVRGASVAAGYLTETPGASSTLDDGTLRTGDAGFLHDGQLYVLGRLGDSMKVRGRAVFAEDVEAGLKAAGVPDQRVAALLGERAGRPTVVALFENADPGWLRVATEVLGARAEGAEVVLVDAPRGTIARTSSGKPKRRRMWRQFVDGRLPGTVATAAPAQITPATLATNSTGGTDG
jgi:acyl-CoA synthetase (AMP-forming)/AMP-acid ligase II